MSHTPTEPENRRDAHEPVAAMGRDELDPQVGTIHPLSQKLFDYVPFLENVPVLGLVLKAYNPRLVLAVGIERIFLRGLAHGFMRLSIQPMLTGRYGLTGAMYQRLSSLYFLGWSLNAFFTAIADTFAVFGYTKRWYCVLFTLGGGVFALLYALLPAKESSAKPAAAFMFMTALFVSNVDVLAQAIYSRRIRRNPAKGPAMVSWSWSSCFFGSMIAAAVQGPLSDNKLTNVGVYTAAGLLFFLSLLFIFNVFGEQPNRQARIEDAKAEFILAKRAERAANVDQAANSPHKEGGAVACAETALSEEDELAGFEEPKVTSVLWGAVEVNVEVVTRNWSMIIYCCVMTAAVVTKTVVTILGTRWELLYTCIAVTVVICVAAFLALPRVVAKTGVYLYFSGVCYLSLPGVLNTFYVAKPACLPDGPHFNYTFMNIMNGIVGNVCSIIGMTLFAHLLQNFSYRAIMGSSAIIIPVVSMFDLIMVMRWNVYIGIPDYALYICGDTVLTDVVIMLIHMPVFLLMSRVAPRGSEAMVLALLTGITHLGGSTSSAIGYILMDTIWPVVTRGKCDYSNAPWLVITGHLVTPLLILPLSFLLLPGSRLCATLDANGNEVQELFVGVDRDVSSSSDTSFSADSARKNSEELSVHEGECKEKLPKRE